ncbi:hypothetical protein EMIT0P258_60352 [Pseudomonas sp. IT-P258]
MHEIPLYQITQSMSLASPQGLGIVFYSCGLLECLRGTPPAGATNRQPHEQHKKPKISFAISLLLRSLYGNHQKGTLHFRTVRAVSRGYGSG